MIVEAHDHEIENVTHGTLVATAGRLGTIEYVYQGEMYVQMMLADKPSARRFYAHEGGVLLAAWARDEQGRVSYIARDPRYGGSWKLPYLNPITHEIIAARLGRDVQDLDEAARWTAAQLQNTVATAILFDRDGILAAWEKGLDGPILVAKSPRPLPSAA
jgi:hypothetical protein